MAGTRPRSPSSTSTSPVAKKVKTDSATATEQVEIAQEFASGLLESETVNKLRESYSNSGPYKYAIVETLFQDDLLTKVKDECLNELSFTEKETDIYKVNQTGDLASLDYLEKEQLSRLPNLSRLRNALYSPEFRSFIRAVTGCGPISLTKTDMSVNSYRKGCHLLNHDDVIGTRRVSYILYMPLPKSETWKPEWGGALELYPVVPGEGGVNEPTPVPSKSIPPSWNQFIFFEVQPGHSFHSVEEVVVDEGEDVRQRLSISGWFHKAQEGEEGYEPEPEEKQLSSLEQLTSSSTSMTPYDEALETPHPDAPLDDDHIAFLSKYLDPTYLKPQNMVQLGEGFESESSLELHSFLLPKLAESLRAELLERDTRDGLDGSRNGCIPLHQSGVGEGSGWKIKGPPHKHRYCVLSEATGSSTIGSADEINLRTLQNELFPSPAFRAWLAHVAKVVPLGYHVEARRFRPGLDYTLATSNEVDYRLDVVLGLTPSPPKQANGSAAADGETNGKGKSKNQEDVDDIWQTGDCGGWECYMSPHDGEEDPAVYRAGGSKKAEHKTNGENKAESSAGATSNGAKVQEADEDDEQMDEDEDEDEVDEDATLLTSQPGFNRLLLVLRDPRLMHFVKYVSSSAPGSRWDICAEIDVGMVAEADDAEQQS